MRSLPPSWWAALAVAAIVVAHVVLVDRSVRTKSPTFDEPLHTLGAYLVAREADHRLNPEDPPLLHWIAAIPLARTTLNLPREHESWDRLFDSNLWSNQFVSETFWRISGNDGLATIAASRRIMLLVDALLIVSAAALAAALAGPAAAVLAASLLALDPLLIGHGSLVKNDVLTALLATLTAASAWSVTRRLSAPRVALAGVVLGLAMIAKFSGILLVLAFALALLIRAMLRSPWPTIGGRTLHTRAQRAAASAIVMLAITPILLAVIWSGYRFRFDPTPAPGRPLSIDNVVTLMKTASLTNELGRTPTPIEVATAPDPLLADAVRFAERHRLLPQAFLQGFLFTAQSAIRRPAFIDGLTYPAGAGWTYFPRALLYKLPIGTLALLALAVAVATWQATTAKTRRMARLDDTRDDARDGERGEARDGQRGEARDGERGIARSQPRDDARDDAGNEASDAHRRAADDARDTAPDESLGDASARHAIDWLGMLCVAIVAGVYLLAALRSPMQLGLRHLLPVLVLAMAGASALLATALRRSRAMHAIVLVLIALLAAESLRAVPNSLAFFNAFVGGARGGLERLSDSNLDWGQDLPALAAWQREHPGVPMSLVLFTSVDPRVYGIEGTHLPGSYWLAVPESAGMTPTTAGVVAVSATRLQATYPFDAAHAEFMQTLRAREPRAVVEGTIYLFDWP
jgi:hypothetical protein